MDIKEKMNRIKIPVWPVIPDALHELKCMKRSVKSVESH